MKTALISVFHKDGIVDFVTELHALGWEIIASGGTAKVLTEAGIPVRDVAELVGGEAILGHRVVTLSREVHAGLLAQYIKTDLQELDELNIPFIDLVCVDLYPLKEEVANPKATPYSVIEKTDIGGPTMLSSAAKGQRIVICDPADRIPVITWLKQGEPNREAMLAELAAKADALVADYRLTSARYHSDGQYTGVIGNRVLECKYGENAWQTPAGLYTTDTKDPLSLDQFRLVAGTAPSYNNLCDVDRLLQTATHTAATFDVNYEKVPRMALGAKHGNCCGAALGVEGDEVGIVQNMLRGDVRAIFGGLVLLNFSVDETIANELLSYEVPEGRRLLDGIIAPSFTDAAIAMLRRKGDKCRFLENPALSNLSKDSLDTAERFRYVRGGFLTQPNYTFVLDLNDPELKKSRRLAPELERGLLLAWAIGSTSNSNTITLVRRGHLLSNGVGQQDRVSASKLAISRATEANHSTLDAVAYSDSFFPFTDGPEVLGEAGIIGIIATSGSVKDPAVKEYCEREGIGLYLLPDKLGRGFFGH